MNTMFTDISFKGTHPTRVGVSHPSSKDENTANVQKYLELWTIDEDPVILKNIYY
jgi:hypothetical protein